MNRRNWTEASRRCQEYTSAITEKLERHTTLYVGCTDRPEDDRVFIRVNSVDGVVRHYNVMFDEFDSVQAAIDATIRVIGADFEVSLRCLHCSTPKMHHRDRGPVCPLCYDH